MRARAVTLRTMKTTTTMPTHDDISARARQIWEDSGRPVGRDDEIWLRAERELRTAGEVNRPDPANATRESRPKSSLRRTATAATG